VSGIGVARDDISSELLEARTDRMIQSQTFVIMREPQAVAGARRILSPSLQALFRSASQRSGMPAEVIEAVAYLESWGDAKAESPDGPKALCRFRKPRRAPWAEGGACHPLHDHPRKSSGQEQE